MRRLKLRGYDNANKCFMYSNSDLHFESDVLICDISSAPFAIEDIEQFTGIPGIFEGDIVSDHNGKGVVEYSERWAAFRVNYRNGQCKWFYHYLDSEWKTIEVIGNIHENPELLEQ